MWLEPPIQLHSLPREPGIYRMLDADRKVLYVGKARNLQRRVSSYFQRQPESPRIQAMVALVRDIECNITASEAEALVLEHNLIKQLKPRYNVLLKDSKSYPYIVLTDERWPRLRMHRGQRSAAGSYFGPFPHAKAVHDTLHVLHDMFRLRDCDDAEFRHRSRPCMQHQIGRCTAPCCGLVSEEAYRQQVQQVEMVLNGHDAQLQQQWETEMQQAAARMDFERAAILRDRIRDLRRIVDGSPDKDLPADADAICIVRQPQAVLLGIGVRRQGRDLGVHTVRAGQAVDADDEEILQSLLLARYRREPPPGQLLLGQDEAVLQRLRHLLRLLHPKQRVELLAPRRGSKAEWLAQVARSSAEQAAHRSLDQQPAFAALARLLGLDVTPQLLAAVDNAHLGGKHMVAAITYGGWQGAEKQYYRRYQLDDVHAGDDYAAMAAVLRRFFSAMCEQRIPQPDILIIDGGRGQLKVARETLDDFPELSLRLLAMAKGERRKTGEETLWLDCQGDADGQPLAMRPGVHDPALLLLARVRDEAHRFAGSYLRKRKKQSMLQSGLDHIPGIGPHKRLALLKHFGGIQGIRAASRQQLAQAPGISQRLAERIFIALHS